MSDTQTETVLHPDFAWLASLVLPYDGRRHGKLTSKVWTFPDTSGTYWTAVLTGHAGVYLLGDGGGADPTGHEAANLRRFLDLPWGRRAWCPWEDFPRWVGEQEATPRCPLCKGRGSLKVRRHKPDPPGTASFSPAYETVREHCPVCDGSGKGDESVRAGLLGGVPVGRQLLRKFLGDGLDVDLLEIRQQPRPKNAPKEMRHTPLTLVAPAWRVVLSPLSRVPEGAEAEGKFFAFPLEWEPAPGAELFEAEG